MAQVCPHFLKGSCRFGANCRNIHPGVNAPAQGGMAPQPMGFGQQPGAPTGFQAPQQPMQQQQQQSQQECRNFKMGSCRFGAACKFRHTVDGAPQPTGFGMAPAQQTMGFGGAPQQHQQAGRGRSRNSGQGATPFGQPQVPFNQPLTGGPTGFGGAPPSGFVQTQAVPQQPGFGTTPEVGFGLQQQQMPTGFGIATGFGGMQQQHRNQRTRAPKNQANFGAAGFAQQPTGFGAVQQPQQPTGFGAQPTFAPMNPAAPTGFAPQPTGFQVPAPQPTGFGAAPQVGGFQQQGGRGRNRNNQQQLQMNQGFTGQASTFMPTTTPGIAGQPTGFPGSNIVPGFGQQTMQPQPAPFGQAQPFAQPGFQNQTGFNQPIQSGWPQVGVNQPQQTQAGPNAKPCRDWMRSGTCRFGARCRFRHEAAPGDTLSEAAEPMAIEESVSSPDYGFGSEAIEPHLSGDSRSVEISSLQPKAKVGEEEFAAVSVASTKPKSRAEKQSAEELERVLGPAVFIQGQFSQEEELAAFNSDAFDLDKIPENLAVLYT